MKLGMLALATVGLMVSSLTGAQADDRGTLADILSAGKITIMNDLSAAPWQFRDFNGNPAGMSIDLDRMIAASLDVDLHLMNVEWAGLIPGLLTRKSDILATTMSTTFKRAQQISFTSETWYSTGTVAIVKPELAGTSWEDLNSPDKRVAVKAGTVSVDVAKQFFSDAEILSFPNDTDTYQALKTDRVDMALNDLAVLDVVNDKYGFVALDLPHKLISSDNWAFAVRPGDVFTWQYLNFFVTKIRENGQLDALYRYWVDGEDWKADFLERNDGVSDARMKLIETLGITDYVPESGTASRETLE